MRISRREFENAVERAIAMIPEMFRAHLGNIAIVVENHPSHELLMEMGIPTDETLFGVFTGVPLPERRVTEPPLYPDEIVIFRKPLMDASRSLDELEEGDRRHDDPRGGALHGAERGAAGGTRLRLRLVWFTNQGVSRLEWQLQACPA